MKILIQSIALCACLSVTLSGFARADALHANGIWYFKPNGIAVTAGTLTENNCTAVAACDAGSLNTDVVAKIAELTPYATFYLAPGSYPVGAFVLKSGQSIQGCDETFGAPPNGEPPALQGAVKLEGRTLIENVKIDNQGLLVDTASRNQAYVGLYLPAGVSATLRDTDVAASAGTQQQTGQNTIGILLENGASLATYGGRVLAQGAAGIEGITMIGGTVAAKGTIVQSSSTNGTAHGINAQQNSMFQLQRGGITARSEGEKADDSHGWPEAAIGAAINDSKLLLSNIDLTVSAVYQNGRLWVHGIRANAAVVTLDEVNVLASSSDSSDGIRGQNGTAVNVTNSTISAISGIPPKNDVCAGGECSANAIMLWNSYVMADNSKISAADRGDGTPTAVWLVDDNAYMRTFNSTMNVSTQRNGAWGIITGNNSYSRNDKAVFQMTASSTILFQGQITFVHSTCTWNDEIVECPY